MLPPFPTVIIPTSPPPLRRPTITPSCTSIARSSLPPGHGSGRSQEGKEPEGAEELLAERHQHLRRRILVPAWRSRQGEPTRRLPARLAEEVQESPFQAEVIGSRRGVLRGRVARTAREAATAPAGEGEDGGAPEATQRDAEAEGRGDREPRQGTAAAAGGAQEAPETKGVQANDGIRLH